MADFIGTVAVLGLLGFGLVLAIAVIADFFSDASPSPKQALDTQVQQRERQLQQAQQLTHARSSGVVTVDRNLNYYLRANQHLLTRLSRERQAHYIDRFSAAASAIKNQVATEPNPAGVDQKSRFEAVVNDLHREALGGRTA